jgi:hypothetical protein
MARLPRVMGRGRALEVLLSADDIRGADAELLGYVNRALPDAELDSFVAHQRGPGDRRRRSQRRNDGAGHCHRRSRDENVRPRTEGYGLTRDSRLYPRSHHRIGGTMTAGAPTEGSVLICCSQPRNDMVLDL